MAFSRLFILLIFLLIIKNTREEKIPVEPQCQDIAVTHKGKLRCCSSYRNIRGKCYPCIGSFGEECSRLCPEGYYGVQCSEKCLCSRCNATTGECFNETEASSSLFVSLAIVTAAVVLCVTSCVILLLRKRKVSSSDKHGNYQRKELASRNLSSPIYTKIHENTYQECEQLSSNYLEVIHSSCQTSEERHLQPDKPEEKVNKRGPRQSILSILMKKNKYADIDMMNRTYIDVIEKDENTEDPVSRHRLTPPQVVTTAGRANTKTTIATAFTEASITATAVEKTTEKTVTNVVETTSAKHLTKAATKTTIATAFKKPSTTAKAATVFLKPSTNATTLAKTTAKGVTSIALTTSAKCFTTVATATPTTINITTSPKYLTTATTKTTIATEKNITTSYKHLTTVPKKTRTATTKILTTADTVTKSIPQNKATGQSSTSSVQRLIMAFESKGKD